MTGALATRERAMVAVDRPQRGLKPRLFDDGLTLEDRILGAWEAIVVDGQGACLVCGGSMAAESGCPDCGAELS
jgi:hypothetical protein